MVNNCLLNVVCVFVQHEYQNTLERTNLFDFMYKTTEKQ